MLSLCKIMIGTSFCASVYNSQIRWYLLITSNILHIILYVALHQLNYLRTFSLCTIFLRDIQSSSDNSIPHRTIIFSKINNQNISTISKYWLNLPIQIKICIYKHIYIYMNFSIFSMNDETFRDHEKKYGFTISGQP